MQYENWLHHGSLEIKAPYCPPLIGSLKCDVLVIGGGFAGLHAALQLADSGKKIILVEKTICGGASSGQSAGFLTPESEEDIAQLIKNYGKGNARLIYRIPSSGVNLIINAIKKYKIQCDFRKQDSLYVAIKESHKKFLEREAESRNKAGLPYELLDEKALKKIHPGRGYLLGLKYSGSYGINSFMYCQCMKNVLIKKGVEIYEDSEVDKIEKNTAKTHLGSVTADNILICIDKMKTEFNSDISKKYYHIQTYLAISEPLTEQEMKVLFPESELMCWDTRLIYSHYRPVEGNRILIGGSSAWASYYPHHDLSSDAITKFIDEIKWRFPDIKDVGFTHYWSGLIDVTKDFIPIVDYDKNNKSIQYAMGCAGLPWAAFCGDYIARRVLDPKKVENISEFASSDRKFFLPEYFQTIFGKRITFALSHLKELMG